MESLVIYCRIWGRLLPDTGGRRGKHEEGSTDANIPKDCRILTKPKACINGGYYAKDGGGAATRTIWQQLIGTRDKNVEKSEPCTKLKLTSHY